MLKRIINYFKSISKDKKAEKEINIKNKKYMCEQAVLHGVCPKTCEICAWNTSK